MKYKFKTKPYDHQLLALSKSWNKREYAYFMEMGTGKSKVLIDNIALLYDRGGINAAVIVAPKGVYRNWSEKEIPAHMPDHVEKYVAVWTPTPTVKQKKELTNLFEISHSLKLFIVNVEAFSTKKGVAFVAKFLLAHSALIAVDESTTIKNPKAQRTKNLLKLAVNTKYRRILTGFPVTQSPLDLYSQSSFLSPQLLGYTSFYSFQNRYAKLINRKIGTRTFRQVVGYHNLEELTNNVKTFSYRVLKKECLDLPDKVYQKRDPDSELKYLISNTQTGGYGITLTEASNVIYYSNNYDLEKRLQSEDRAHRIGQTNKVTYIDLVAKGTVDEKIVKALRNKLDLAQEVLGDEKWKDWIS